MYRTTSVDGVSDMSRATFFIYGYVKSIHILVISRPVLTIIDMSIDILDQGRINMSHAIFSIDQHVKSIHILWSHQRMLIDKLQSGHLLINIDSVAD